MNNKIKIAHGNGGTQMQELLREIVFPQIKNKHLAQQEDGAILQLPNDCQTVFTTDAFTVQPMFFPGGDIGHLAVCGTVNDLAMMGAVPVALSLALIIEAGLELDVLKKIMHSIGQTAAEAGVSIVTGDTKVVDHGQADKIFITTSGVGWRKSNQPAGISSINTGDAIIVSGTIGHHGMAILAARTNLPLASPPQSDAAVLNHVVADLLEQVPQVKWLRDPTRGGMAAALNELSCASGHNINLEHVPVSEEINGLAELLGVDPLYMANEGRFVMVCPAEDVQKSLAVLHQHDVSKTACQIALIDETSADPKVLLKMAYGSSRIIEMPSGEQLPRIC